MRAIILALGLSLLAVPALAQDAQGTAPPPAASDQAAPPADQVPAAPAPAQANPPQNPTMTGPQLLISTSMGDITLQLDSQRAPKSVANVLRYVREKHYDGTAMYRVVKGFVIQMGSFDAKGQGRGVYPGSVPLEANNGLHNLRGAAALAHGDDPDSATADFFIDVDDNPSLDKNDTSPGLCRVRPGHRRYGCGEPDQPSGGGRQWPHERPSAGGPDPDQESLDRGRAGSPAEASPEGEEEIIHTARGILAVRAGAARGDEFRRRLYPSRSPELAAFVARNGPLDHFVRCANRFSQHARRTQGPKGPRPSLSC